MDGKTMIVSMTAIGHCESEDHSIYIKSVNGKGLDTRFRWPKDLLGIETEAKKIIKSLAKRGTIEIHLADKRSDETKKSLKEFVKFCKKNNLATPSYQDYYLYDQSQQSNRFQPKSILKTVEKALANWQERRKQEGSLLKSHLEKILLSLKKNRQQLESAPKNMQMILKDKLTSWLNDLDIQIVDPARLAQEYGVMKDRHDIEEELARIDVALKLFEETLEAPEGPHGRKLEFTIQELHREFTTLSNKLYGTTFQTLLVECKSLIDQLKEQTLNIE